MYDGLGSLPDFLSDEDFPNYGKKTRFNSMPQTACSAQDKHCEYDEKRLCSRDSFLSKLRSREISSRGFEVINSEKTTDYLHKTSPRKVHSLIEQRAKLASRSKPRQLVQSPKEEKPSYKEVSCKVNTRRDQPRDKQLESLDNYSHKLQERVRNELLMKKHHHLLRTMKKTFREEEERHNKQYSQSETFFQRLAARMRNPKAEDISEFNREDMHVTNPLQNPVIAAKKTIDIPIQKWMKQRGVFNQTDKKFSDLAKGLFNMLDVNNVGFIRGKELVKECMELSVVAQPQIISDSLITIFNTKDLNALKLSLDEFRALLRGDSKTDHMLDRLNQDAISYKKKLDEKKSSFLVSYDAGASILTSHKRSNSTSDAHPLHILKFDLGKQSEFSKSITFKDLHAILDKWWSELNTLKSNQVHINSVCDKLVKLEIIGDRKEARKYIENVLGPRSHIDNIGFHRIFLRCLLKDLVYLFAEKLMTIDISGYQLSGKYIITKFKRELIQAGLKMNSDSITFEEGHTAIQAIERYHNFINESISQTDFEQFKEEWAKTTGKPYVEMIADYSMESAPDVLRSFKTSKKRKTSNRRTPGDLLGSLRDNIKIQPKLDLDKEPLFLSIDSKTSHHASLSPLPINDNTKLDIRKVKTFQQARKDIVASPGLYSTFEEIPTIHEFSSASPQLARQPSTRVIYEPEKNTSFTITAVRPVSGSRLSMTACSVQHTSTSNSSAATPSFLAIAAIKSTIRKSPNLNSISPFQRGTPISFSNSPSKPQKRIIKGIKEKPELKIKASLKGKTFSYNPERTPHKSDYLFDREYREYMLVQQNKLYEDFQNQVNKHI